MKQKVMVTEAPQKQKAVIERLMQLYMYDFSEMEGFDVGRDGLFEHDLLRLDSYWTETERTPFLIRVDGKIAGFVLVNAYTCLEQNRGAKSIAEFFVMRKYRRQGIGTSAAFHVFDTFRGKWEVRQIRANVGAQRFWRAVINEYTGGHYEETVLDNPRWCGTVQSFDNGV